MCGTPGKDGPGGVLSGIVNTYYPGATASASAGATTITLGVATGAATPIAPGDLLLVIQMQDALIDATNTASYGAGTGTGAGATDYRSTGRYEYVTATSAVGLGGGALTLRGTGAGNGLLNSYSDAAPTAASGQRRYQVVRVPQYSSATLGGGLTAAYWNGATGGILAIDVAGQLTLGGTVSVDGRGFRGGAGLGFTGGAGGTNTDFRNLSSNPFHGIKGEGVAGTPRWVLDPATGTNTDLGTEGYPNGDAAEGAPGNAGGGGTDGHPSVNDQNSGGGGGSNGGAAGQGGFSWSTSLDRGGRGGQAFSFAAVSRIILGGGGGAGTRNNSSAPRNAGGAGGGIVLIRTGTVTGAGTITANGLVGRSPDNDGAGGGGAGGSIVVLAASGGLGSLTVQARGGNGGDAWPAQAGAGSAHGPGGGGSGGVAVLSSAASTDLSGGTHGITTTGNLAFGATDGAGGLSLTAAIAASPGTSASPLCVPSLSVTKTTSTATVSNGAAGTTATYTIVVTNTANRDTARSVALIDSLPTGFTFASALAPVLTGGASRPSTTDPTAGAAIPLWAAYAIPGGGQVSQTFTVTVGSSVPNGVYNNSASANYLDPARTTPAGTTSAAYDTTGAGENVTVRGVNLTTTKTHAGIFPVGLNGTYTITQTNAGNIASSGTVTVTDTLPAGLSFVSGTGTGWVCAAVSQVVTCTGAAAIAAGASAPAITLTVGVAAAAAPGVTNVAWVSGGNEPVANRGDNSASDPTTVNGLAADVVTTKTGPATVAAGANATYTIAVNNAGPNPATSVLMTDTLPAGATFVNATGGGTLSGSVVTWPAIASLANGGSASVTVTVTFASGGVYTNIAASTATAPDPTPGNNDGSAAGSRVSTTVTPVADLTVSKSGAATGTAGASIVYTIGVSNAGPSAATGVVVTDTLPAGAVFVSATGGGTLAGTVVTWPTVATIASGGSVSFTVTVTFAAGGSFTDIAAATSTTTDPTLPDRATAATTITASADVVTTKTGPATAATGAAVTYSITTANSGPSTAAVVVVTDTLPAGATFVSASAGGTAGGNVVTWPAIATLASGANAVFTVTVSYPAPGSYLNLAASASATGDPTPANNNGSAAGARVTTVVSTTADLAITNTGAATASAGANVPYTITATNGGPNAAAAVVVTDTLPAGATFVSATGGGTLAGNVVTWPTIATLANGGTATFTLTLSYPAAGNYSNTAAVASSTTDPNLANNTAAATTAVGTSADVVTTKTGPATVTAAANATYTITATNNGPSSAANVVVTDTLPAGAVFVSATGGGTLSGSVVAWPATASLAGGAGLSFSVTVSYPVAGSYTDIAASTSATPDPTPANNDGSAAGARVTTTVTPSADLSITNVGPATASAGANVVYTITATNGGPSPAASVIVTDTLPAGAVFVSATGGGTRVGSIVTWPAAATVASGGSVSFTLTLTYPAAGTYTNAAAVGSATADPNLANNRAAAATVVATSADVVTTKAGPGSVAAGVNAAYTITTLNNGPSAAVNVIVTDTLPAGATFVSATNGGTITGNVVSWPAVASLVSNASLSFTVTVAYPVAGTYVDIAASSSTTADPSPANNNGSAAGARVSTSVSVASDLSIAKSGPVTAPAGADLVFTLTATNSGPSPASSVLVTDTLPAGVTFVSASAGGTLSGNVVTWPAVAAIANGATAAFTVTYRAASSGTFTDIAAVTAAGADPNLANNRATATTTVTASADVVTTKSGPATATAGQNVSYTITTTNNGPSAATGVTVTDNLPAGVTFVSASGGGLQVGNVVTWPTIATLGSGASQSLTVVVTTTAAGSITNIAASTATTSDPTPGNNDGSAPGARATTAVSPAADVATTKSGPASASVGQDLIYSVGVSNAGPSPAVNVVVTDTIPAGTVFVSATGGGIFASGVITWPAIASLASGASTSFSVTLRATTTGTIVNRVASTSTTPDPVPANNNGSSAASQASTAIDAEADLVTTKAGPASVIAGQDIVYTIATANNGPSPATGVVVSDTLPAGLTFVSATNGGTLAAGVVTWPAVVTLASGASLSYTVVVRAADPGAYLDIAASTSATPDVVPANNDGSAAGARVTTSVTGSADLVVTKSGPATATAGTDVLYTISALNNGPSAALNVVVTDTLAPGAVFVSASAGGTVAGNVVTWAPVASLPNGGTANHTVIVRFSNAGGYLDIAAGTSTTADPVPANNDGSAPNARVITVIGASADLVTTKTGPAVGPAGTDIVYTITTVNNGPSAANNVVVSDSLPTGATFVSASAGGVLGGGVVTWPAVGSMANGATVSYTVTVRYLASGAFTDIAASASTTPDPFPTSNDGSPPSGRVSTVVGPSADVATTKTGPATAIAGQDIIYTITTTNHGPTTATGVVVTDTLPAGVVFISVTGGGALTGNVITWPAIASLGNGAASSVTVVVRALAAGTFQNLAASSAVTPDPDQSNNNGSAAASRVTTVVSVSADVMTTKTGPATAAVGQNFSYIISVTNAGPSLAGNVVVSDTLPTGLVVVSATGAPTQTGNVLTWPVMPSLAAGLVTTFTVTVRAAAPGTFTNLAASTSSAPDPAPANNDGSSPGARVVTAVSNNSDVSIAKSGPATAIAGQNIVYTIVATNNGPAVATGVSVADTLPAGASFVTASAGGVVASNVVTWPSIPSLASGATATFTVTLRANAAGSFVDIAGVTSTSADPVLTNNRAVASTAVAAGASSADVITTKSGVATTISGGTIVYTIQTINSGPDAAVSVVVTDTLPAGVTLVSASGGATRSGNVLTWPTIPSLANGASVTYTVTVTAPASGTIVNIAASTSPTPDPVLPNNNGSATNSRTTTVITQAADLITTKSGPANAAVGATVTHLISTRNAGPDPAINAQVIDSLPAGALFVSASDGGGFAGGVVTWPIVASLPNGATITRSVTVIAPAGATMTNVARSTSATADPNPDNNRGVATTTLSSSADVVTTKTGPAKVDAGAEISYTIVSRNRGPNPAVAVVVVDSLPAGVTFVSATDGGVLTGRAVIWPAVAVLAVGDSVVHALVVTAPAASATLTNVVASTAAGPDPNPGNNNGSDSSSRVTTEVAPVDLSIVKTHLGDLIRGTVAIYRLAVTNVGQAATTGPIVVRDTVPAGLTFQSAEGSGWSCVNAGPIVTCRYPAAPFAPGASTAITLKALVALDAPATVTNRGHVSTPSDADDAGNNVSADPATVATIDPIAIEKTASRAEAELTDQIDYRIVIRNRTAALIPGVTVTDRLPKGFAYQRRTARIDQIPVADPAGAPGPSLTFPIGDLEPNAVAVLTYRVAIGAGATLGDGINRARARTGTGLQSAEAVAVVRVRGGVFSDRGLIVGKVYLRCNCDSTGRAAPGHRLDRDTLGVAGVRIFLEDGTSVVTDVEGKYNFAGLISGLHVLKVDPTTLPRGAALVVLDSRNAGDSSSRFVDLKNGELHKADFAIRYADSVQTVTDLRRDQGEVTVAIIDTTVTPAPDTAGATAPAYRALAAQASANPVDEANRLPVRRLPGTTVPLTTVPNGSIEVVPARRSLPADGTTKVTVRIRVLDQDRKPLTTDQPVTLETSLGRWLVPDLDPVEPGVQAILPGGQDSLTLVASAEAGIGEIRVTNGLRVSTTQVVFVPAERPLFLNGLVEARVDLRSLLRGGLVQTTSADRFERELTDLRVSSDNGRFTAGARAALFLQGKVKGSTLLTIAYDTERDPERRMFRDIQPDEFYPVYGDASIKEFGTQSFDRLYVRIDAQRSFALYGDYVTPAAGSGALAARELGAYQRSLTGALVHGENRRGQVDVFATRDRLSQVVEELPGRGISGPYQLTRTDGRLNSEKVEILTRERNQPSRIMTAAPLNRFTDYTLEPFTGRLLFFTPVPSVDADLNPVSIRVSYEVERTGQDFWVYGADGQLRVNDKVELGASLVRDEQPLSSRQLYSANAAFSLGAGTVLITEFARTAGDSASFRGDAARFELRHSSAKLQGSVFGATSDPGFSNQSSTFQRGRTELGLRGSAVLDPRTRLLGEALRTEDRIGGGHRTGLLAGVERQFGKFVRAEVGYRFADERGGPASAGTAATPAATPNATNAIRTRVTFQIPGQPRASVFGELEQDVAHGDQRRGALGGQYVLFDRLRLYGRHEFLSSFAGPFALNGAERQATTVIGLDAGYARDGQFFGEYRARDAFAGRETEAAIGLRNRWNLARGLVVNTGFERVDVLKGTGTGEATALTAGAEYTTNPAWRGTARLEYRFAPAGDDFLGTVGYARKLDRDWTVLGRALYNTFGNGGKRTRNQIGFAWRETDRNRWNGLARWENRFERLSPNSAAETVKKSTILAANLNYQPLSSVWLSGRFAGKWASDRSNAVETSTRATLISVRGLYDFLPRWDAGLIGSTLWSGGTQFGLGLELGRVVVKNLRAAVGYNVFGFRDGGLGGDGSATDHGLYLHFGFKFDEDAFKRIAGDTRRP